MNITVVQLVHSSVLTTNSRAYSLTDCSVPDYYYEALQLSILTTGYYRLSSNSIVGLHGYIYQNTFDPSAPLFNLLVEKDGELGFRLSIFLEANMAYVLVVTSVVPNQTGAFSIGAAGPNHISVRRMGKFDCC